MSASPFISIDASLWSQRIIEFAKIKKIKVADALRDEFRYTLERIVKLTPPEQRAQGDGAVKRDISRVFRPFDPANVTSKRMRTVVEKGDILAFNAIAAKVKQGPMKGAHAVMVTKQLHKNARDRRGRVLSQKNQVVLGNETKVLAKYIKSKLAYVGIAKAGWAPALIDCGGSVPAWVGRQTAYGSKINRLNEDSPSITAINRTPWAVRKDEGARIMATAFTSRAKNIATKIRVAIKVALAESKLGTK